MQILKILFVLCLLKAISISSFAQNADINLLEEINLNRNKLLDLTFRFITNTASPVTIATPIVIYSVGLINKDSTLKSKGIYIAETVVVSAIFTTALKHSIKRERPFETYPYIETVSCGGSPSFPSGHTSDVFATATSLSLAFQKWYVIAPSYAWASAVGYSRMNLGVHYPSDVLAGAVIGAGSAYLTYKLNNWLRKP